MFNNAFPAGTICVDDAVKQMNAAYGKQHRQQARARPAGPAAVGRDRRLPAAGIHRLRRAHRLPGPPHALEQLPQGPAAQRGVHRPRPTTPRSSRTSIFWRAVRNTFIWACTSPLIEVTIALLLALALYAKVPGMRFFRIAWFTPVLMSYVVVGIIWVWIYNYDWGAANALLRLLGLGTFVQAWIGDPKPRCPRSSSSPPGCGPASTWWCCSRAALAPLGGDRGGRARQLRLGGEARGS